MARRSRGAAKAADPPAIVAPNDRTADLPAYRRRLRTPGKLAPLLLCRY